MKIVPTVMFSERETCAMVIAARNVNILLPSDGPDRVAPDDPRRKALRQIAQRHETFTAERLGVILDVLNDLCAVVRGQSNRSYWHGFSGGFERHHEPMSPAVAQMAATLAEARLLQYRDTLLACEIVRVTMHMLADFSQTGKAATGDADCYDRAADAAFSLLMCDLEMREECDGDVTGVIAERADLVYVESVTR